MLLFRRPRLGLSVAVVIAAISAVVGALAPPAQAFEIQNHERITRDALTPVGVDPAALGQILVGPPPGGGAIGSDAFSPMIPHIDNAAAPVDICARTQQAWNFFTPMILSGAQPAGPGGTELVDGPGARAAFGGLAHALQDFYSHSNWVEATSPSDNWTACHLR